MVCWLKTGVIIVRSRQTGKGIFCIKPVKLAWGAVFLSCLSLFSLIKLIMLSGAIVGVCFNLVLIF